MSVNDFSNNGKGLATQHTDALHVLNIIRTCFASSIPPAS